ncbi:MAG: bi-domain-containing oxidoreductase [Ignavibacteria bacterium]|nr:bi-domain-containing oxidoreductase [Ignavibacteria bacterium]
MKQLVQRIKDGEMKVVDLPIPFLKPKGVLVKNYFSLISAGTERTTVETGKENLILKAYKNPDVVKQVYQIIRRDGLIPTIERILGNLEDYKTLGYSSAGIVIESSSEKFKPGDRVACAGAGYANHAEVVYVPENLCVKLPESVSLEEGAFTTLGAIALQGVRLANPTLGEKIVVIGLGLLGLITVQLLKANGCTVIGLDVSDEALEFAKKFNCDYVFKSSKSEKDTIINLTDGYGADKVLITAGTESNEPIELSGLITREKGKVIVVGAVKMDIPRGPYFSKEIEIVISKSYGPGRYDPKYEEYGIDYPYGYVRWTENRNMQSIVELIAQKKLDVNSLITHKFKIDEYQKAYDLILGKSNEFYRGILFEYQDEVDLRKKTFYSNTKTKKIENIRIGFIGAGSFAQSSLLPHLKNLNVSLVNVCTTDGLSSSNVARKFGFEKFTTSPEEIINDNEINVVFIATRHDSHAKYVIEALKAGKKVFVEKPLAIYYEELREIIDLNVEEKFLLVGFNRRFAKSIQDIKKHFPTGPFNFLYRVNAGKLPLEHWTQFEDQGGRIIGEVCHFIDTLSFLCNSYPKQVFAQTISDKIGNNKEEDTLSILIKFEDGSIGTIVYQANGDAALPKEYLEVSSLQRTAILNNFESVDFYAGGKKRTKNYYGKGHKEEVEAFINAIKNGYQPPIELKSLYLTTQTTFAIVQSIRTGQPVEVKI